VVLPVLELSGLKAGRDFHLSYSPERVDPRSLNYKLSNTPKLVSGLTDKCLALSINFYSSFVDETVPVPTLEEAEMAKLVENAYRFVNISFVNELSVHCAKIGINVWNVIDAAATKPYGFQRFDPGPGVGGHCIPVDPLYLSHYVRSETGDNFQLIAAARKVNQEMPERIIERLMACISNSDRGRDIRKVLLVGVGYKAGVKDTRESPATGIASILMDAGFVVEFYDSWVSDFIVDGKKLERISSLEDNSFAYAVLLLQKVENLSAIVGKNFDSKLVIDLKNNSKVMC
jgi:nucleotide sugar dehydrogenase